MDKIITLTIAGILLFGAEIFVPGGILGFLAVCAIGGAVALTWIDYGTTYGLIALAAAIVLALIGIALEMTMLRHTRFGRKFFLTSKIDEKARTKQPVEEELVGKSGESLTQLNPSGVVRVDGRRYEALSQSGMLDRGTPVVVVGRDAFRVVVRIGDAEAGGEEAGNLQL